MFKSTTALSVIFTIVASASFATEISLGPRPAYLVDQVQNAELKEKLLACAGNPAAMSKFSIGHRGAALQFPEHTNESYTAAARQGAGIIECDVTFTKDKELVCRHAQNDLATTTNILTSDLAETCVKPFAAGEGAECRTSEITLSEFKTLNGKMDASNAEAQTVEDFMNATANWRTDLYATKGTLMTHKESIALIDSFGADFTPELKSASVEMPYESMSQEDYAQKMIDEYKEAGIDPSRVWAQSFNLDDILYWIKNEPDFGKQAVYLDDRDEVFDEDEGQIDPNDPATFKPSMEELKAMGVNYIAPPLWMLVTLENDKIVPSAYAVKAKEAGLDIITWTLERSGPLNTGGGWYFQSIESATNNDGVYFELLDVLAKDVGVIGVFSDWPATTTYYANCMGL